MALLSLLLPGLGQVVLGQAPKGFAMLGGSALLAFLSGFVLMIFVWPAVAVDAYFVARKLQRGEPVEAWEFFPR